MTSRRRSALVYVLSFLAATSWLAAQSSGNAPSGGAKAKPAEAVKLSPYRDLSYRGLASGEVQLASGTWTGTPAPGGESTPRVDLIPLAPVLVDLDGDGQREAVVVLAEQLGGSGTFLYLAVVNRRDGEYRNTSTIALGDRVQLRDLTFGSGLLIVDLVVAGAEDPLCCPTQRERRHYDLVDGQLVELKKFAMGAHSLADLEGVVWSLDVPAGGEVDDKRPTLRFEKGRVYGDGGCSRYASTATGAKPGEIAIAPVRALKRACRSPETLANEAQFFARLQGATAYSWSAGRLQVDYTVEGVAGRLLFLPKR